MSLRDHLIGDRGIAAVEVAPGVQAPLRFTDPLLEHAATRRDAGLFDFSFMACFDIAGPDATRCLEGVQTRRLHALAPGEISYTLLCRSDGSVLNDATVWCRARGHYTLFTGRRSDRAHLAGCAHGLDVEVRDLSEARAAVAVQGPRALQVLQAALPGHAWETLGYFRFRTVDFGGVSCDIARLGYTGEPGFEAVTDASAGPALWQRLARAGASLGLAECGFEAANALRIEAGFILFSRELVQHVTPCELGLGRLVVTSAAGFVGARALARLRWRSPARRLVGLLLDPADDAPATALRDEAPLPGGAVLTSACRSPWLGRWIGLGFVTPEDANPGTRVGTGDRRATVARLPFYDPMKLRPRRGWRAPPASGR